jgi:hypothetical protein
LHHSKYNDTKLTRKSVTYVVELKCYPCEWRAIRGILPLYLEIFDIDIHRIPENKAKNEPAHLHYDIRYLLRAPHENFSISDESDALAWWSHREIVQRAAELDDSVLRMAERYFR